LIVAMFDGADMRIVAAALESAGIGLQALTPAEDAALLEIEGGVLRFRHPLIRSAVLQTASPSTRRAAHRAAAHGLHTSTRIRDHEARIWHLADAVVGVNESVASLLDALGDAAT